MGIEGAPESPEDPLVQICISIGTVRFTHHHHHHHHHPVSFTDVSSFLHILLFIYIFFIIDLK